MTLDEALKNRYTPDKHSLNEFKNGWFEGLNACIEILEKTEISSWLCTQRENFPNVGFAWPCTHAIKCLRGDFRDA